jgi:hypothetical protein
MIFVRSNRIIRILVAAAIAYVASAGAGLRAQQMPLPAGVPAPPPGGVVGSKLPDTDGVHLGMGQDEAVALMKRLFPGTQLTTYTTKSATGSVFVNRMTGASANDCSDNCEVIDMLLSAPPAPVQVISIQRTINIAKGKQPTFETTVASLRQKYGKELPLNGNGVIMSWAYDEQGQPIIPKGPANWVPDCAGGTIGVAPLPPTPLADQLPGLTKNLCNFNVYVHAVIGTTTVQNTQVVTQVLLTLGEKSMMLRDAVLDREYLDGVTAVKQKQEQDANTQKKAPTL